MHSLVIAKKSFLISEPGWREIYFALEEALAKRKAKEKGKKGKSGEGKEDETLPLMKVGDLLPVTKKDFAKKKTKAPSIHTESSILAMMETAGKELDSDELREAMKDSGLGTPATRAGMIERLLQRAYIERDKKKLVPTTRGISLIGLVTDQPIANPELTGAWEMRLNQIAKGEYASDKFMEEVKNYTREVVSFLGANRNGGRNAANVQKVAVMPNYQLTESKCPKCKEGTMLRGKRAFGCSRYAEGCNFTIKPMVAGKLIEKEHLVDLLANGTTTGSF